MIGVILSLLQLSHEYFSGAVGLKAIKWLAKESGSDVRYCCEDRLGMFCILLLVEHAHLPQWALVCSTKLRLLLWLFGEHF